MVKGVHVGRRSEPVYELWDTIEDEEVPALNLYEVSSLGRVRRKSDGTFCSPMPKTLARGKPRVRFYINSRRVTRSIRSMVTQIFGSVQADVAILAVNGGLDNLLDVRTEMLEKIEVMDQAITLLALPELKPAFEKKVRPVTMRDFALREAAELGASLRHFPGVDPVTHMTRPEKLSRLRRLRGAYGAVIDDAAQVPLLTPDPFDHVHSH
jgi:hypothetical protein